MVSQFLRMHKFQVISIILFYNAKILKSNPLKFSGVRFLINCVKCGETVEKDGRAKLNLTLKTRFPRACGFSGRTQGKRVNGRVAVLKIHSLAPALPFVYSIL